MMVVRMMKSGYVKKGTDTIFPFNNASFNGHFFCEIFKNNKLNFFEAF